MTSRAPRRPACGDVALALAAGAPSPGAPAWPCPAARDDAVQWARALEAPPRPIRRRAWPPRPAPTPRPPVEARPTRLLGHRGGEAGARPLRPVCAQGAGAERILERPDEPHRGACAWDRHPRRLRGLRRRVAELGADEAAGAALRERSTCRRCGTRPSPDALLAREQRAGGAGGRVGGRRLETRTPTGRTAARCWWSAKGEAEASASVSADLPRRPAGDWWRAAVHVLDFKTGRVPTRRKEIVDRLLAPAHPHRRHADARRLPGAWGRMPAGRADLPAGQRPRACGRQGGRP